MKKLLELLLTVVKKLLKFFGIAVMAVVLLIGGFVVLLLCIPMVPSNYTEKVPTGGAIEAKYLAMGDYPISYYEEATDDKAIKKYEVWYPEALKNGNRKYPAVVVVNGTGVFASKVKPIFKHLASWGFIVIGNEDGSTWNGSTADKTLARLLTANEDPESIFYGKVDTDNIGITGHSQGGVGVFNAVNRNEHGDLSKCAISLSPTEEEMAALLKMPYDPSMTRTPVLLLASSENDVISAEKMNDMYDKISAPKAMALKSGRQHGEMLYFADGYATAWFMWHLQGDAAAGEAFTGDSPELLRNALYQDRRIYY